MQVYACIGNISYMSARQQQMNNAVPKGYKLIKCEALFAHEGDLMDSNYTTITTPDNVAN